MTNICSCSTQMDRDRFAQAIKEFSMEFPKTAGMEMERFLLHSDGTLPNKETHDALYKELLQRLGKSGVSVEPTAHMIEIMSNPHLDADSIVYDIQKKISVLKEEAQKLDLRLISTSDLPDVAIDEQVNNLVSKVDPASGTVRRAYEVSYAYESHGWENISTYSRTTTSMHFTHSVKDVDMLHRWAKVHYALSPLYYTVFENRTRDKEGRHIALSRRRALQDRGLVADYVFDSSNGNELINKFIQFVYDTPMPTILDAQGNNEMLSSPLKFSQLPQEKKTLDNFLQAASFSWNICKLKPVIDTRAFENGSFKLDNLLLEVRDFDTSDGALPVIAHWLCTLTRSEENLIAVENALESLGMPICSDPQVAKEKIKETLKEVETTQDYLKVPFGVCEGVNLRDLVHGVVLPILKHSESKLYQMRTWQDISTAPSSTFKKAEKIAKKSEMANIRWVEQPPFR